MFNYRYGIVCNEKYFYEIEADNANDALAVAKEFFEDDCAHGLCGNETSYRTGTIITSEEHFNMYLVIDKELINEEPIVYGLFTTEEKANEAKNHIIDLTTEEVFAIDPKESGVDREYDEKWVRKKIADTISTVEIKEFDKILFKEE